VIGCCPLAASAAAGGRVSAKCQACHSFDQGGPNLTGPNLYGVVGRQSASVGGFGYSAAMREWGGEWTYENLDAYLKNPSGYINGTAMSFIGLRKDDERAAMIAYLAQQSDNPPAFPEPLPEEEPAAEEPAAEDGAAESAEGDEAEAEDGGSDEG